MLKFLFCVIFSVVISHIYGDKIKHTAEYCSLKTFSPQCGQGEVIIIEKAMYGRMSIGQCVKKDYGLGTIGCDNDEKGYFDSKCSGRRNCELFIPIPVLSEKLACLQEMSPYLEATYYCQKVYKPISKMCNTPLTIPATTRTQYLSSLVTKESSCGLHQTPYILEAKEGQRVKVMLYDFSLKSNEDGKQCNVRYGYILDTKIDDVINLCKGRMDFTFTSLGNNIQILLEQAVVQNNYFIIEFQAIGCPEIVAPKYTWMQKENNTVKFGCQSSSDMWSLRCIGNIWLGVMKNCTEPRQIVKHIPKAYGPKTDIESKPKEEGMPEVSDNHLFAIAIGCITIIICCSTVVLGVHCAKRYELSMEKKSVYNMNTLTHRSVCCVGDTLTTVPVGDTLTTVPVGDTLSMFNTIDMPAYTFNRNGNVSETITQNNRPESEIYQSIHGQPSLLG